MHNLHDGERDDNVNSIRSVPMELLPSGPARRTLMGMARDGYDVYAEAPLQIGNNDSEQRWHVWYNGHCYPLGEWLAEFDKGVPDPKPAA